jgi:hypothetical protein
VEYYSKEFCSNEGPKLSKYVCSAKFQNKNNILQTFLVEFFADNGVAMMLNTVFLKKMWWKKKNWRNILVMIIYLRSVFYVNDMFLHKPKVAVLKLNRLPFFTPQEKAVGQWSAATRYLLYELIIDEDSTSVAGNERL